MPAAAPLSARQSHDLPGEAPSIPLSPPRSVVTVQSSADQAKLELITTRAGF